MKSEYWWTCVTQDTSDEVRYQKVWWQPQLAQNDETKMLTCNISEIIYVKKITPTSYSKKFVNYISTEYIFVILNRLQNRRRFSIRLYVYFFVYYTTANYGRLRWLLLCLIDHIIISVVVSHTCIFWNKQKQRIVPVGYIISVQWIIKDLHNIILWLSTVCNYSSRF